MRAAGYLVQAPIIQANSAQFSAPDATRIQGEEPGREPQSERRPVAADDGAARAPSPRYIEPRKIPFRGLRSLALCLELHDAFARAEAQARHRIHDDAQAVGPSQAVAPAIGSRAIERAEKSGISRPSELDLDLTCEGHCAVDVPLRQEAGVNQDDVTCNVDHRPGPKPVEQLFAVGRGQHIGKRVVPAVCDVALGQGEQVQIVVAQHDHCAIPEAPHEAQGCERSRTAVDQISNEPQRVLGAVETAQL
jgi:hypothetical protein